MRDYQLAQLTHDYQEEPPHIETGVLEWALREPVDGSMNDSKAGMQVACPYIRATGLGPPWGSSIVNTSSIDLVVPHSSKLTVPIFVNMTPASRKENLTLEASIEKTPASSQSLFIANSANNSRRTTVKYSPPKMPPLLYLWAHLAPPIAVKKCGKDAEVFTNVVLCLLFWIPGVLHAMFVVNRFRARMYVRQLKVCNGVVAENKFATANSKSWEHCDSLQDISRVARSELPYVRDFVEFKGYKFPIPRNRGDRYQYLQALNFAKGIKPTVSVELIKRLSNKSNHSVPSSCLPMTGWTWIHMLALGPFFAIWATLINRAHRAVGWAETGKYVDFSPIEFLIVIIYMLQAMALILGSFFLLAVVFVFFNIYASQVFQDIVKAHIEEVERVS